ncbi:MAG: methyltransferase domain-containing protein, partial [Chloroflexi bacterium]|nr:methyltransferase domain-containing protein [Chloroflexota bacterium]
MTTPLHQGQIAGTQWNPGQYLKFSDHRLRPALELLDRIPAAQPDVIYDLGAGTGSVTRHIAERWPSATVYGLDSSKEMIQQASADPGRVTWIEADIRTWQPDAPVDSIY